MLTGCHVLTAHHCLGGIAPEAEDVEVELESGEVLPGRVYRRCPAADLALIDVPKSGAGPIIPRGDHATAGKPWRNPYRPSPGHAFLSGTIHAVPVPYQCEGGDSIEAMQLGCVQDLRDYAGYSGSPIEGSASGGESRIIGILIEQYPEHYTDDGRSTAASMVLFAATLSEVFQRFDCFHVNHLISLLPSSSSRVAPAPRGDGDVPPAAEHAQWQIAAADAKIKALEEWQRQGLLDGQIVTALKLQVIERHLLGGDAGERP